MLSRMRFRLHPLGVSMWRYDKTSFPRGGFYKSGNLDLYN